MERQLFRIAVSAAKRESLAGYNDNAMDYLRSALGYANTLNCRKSRSLIMKAMNAIRANEKRKANAPAAAKASPLPAILVSNSITLQHAVVGAACLVGLLVGLSLPFHAPMGSYELVEYRGTDSDIIDSRLSVEDCAAVLPTMRAIGHKVECRSPVSR